ncbi:hypothetical protein M5X00_29565 [Paenibacillus alvei]|uniref:hypothetical protein n=1 Tax=Paenibacillus alvei TaxID=44250 RepID=UPI000288E114|nr:hypothetical protein [Paenibacillus alvei]EJW14021.1 hypothetical protein PAV_141p01270 [Paenibacillus alvei DSM 29]MCY9544691.1 hypothetical protein [Paenibacillus alvei]MCY9707626.1 hypothetical protein [Paenibacillus alvei]MCY9758369.1 hypothetical protein [Paenibacillus alvei]MEC0082862.1 hypothetical protein [Paenibacillus alvei]
MQEIDLKLKLFSGRAMTAEGYGDIEPLTIREIVDVGYSEYMKCLNIMTLTTKDFLDEEPDDISILDLLLVYGGEEIEHVFEQALSLFLKGEIVVDKEDMRVFVKVSNEEIYIVNKENYREIQEVIKWQNYINNFDEKKLDSNFDPADEETRKLKEQMDAVAKRRDELKRKQNQSDSDKDEDDIDFYDILSAISSKSYGINELNVLDLTVYQVYRKFKRMEIIDQYDISIKSILAGAKDIKIKHWSSKD